MVWLEPDVEIVVPIETLDAYANIPFTFKAKNVFNVPIDVYAQSLSEGAGSPSGWNAPKHKHFGSLGVGAENYFLYDFSQRSSLPATDTVEYLLFRIRYLGSPGGVPQPREISKDDVRYTNTYIDFDDGSYVLVDEDTFETDLDGWAKVDEVGATVLDRSQVQRRNGSWSMRHSAIDNTDVAYLTKSFVIGAVSKAYIRVPVFFEVTDQEKVTFEIITDAGDVVKKRTQGHAIAASPVEGSKITGMWLYLGAELPVDGTYEVRLRATCESGAALEIFYDDIKVITKA